MRVEDTQDPLPAARQAVHHRPAPRHRLLLHDRHLADASGWSRSRRSASTTSASRRCRRTRRGRAGAARLPARPGRPAGSWRWKRWTAGAWWPQARQRDRRRAARACACASPTPSAGRRTRRTSTTCASGCSRTATVLDEVESYAGLRGVAAARRAAAAQRRAALPEDGAGPGLLARERPDRALRRGAARRRGVAQARSASTARASTRRSKTRAGSTGATSWACWSGARWPTPAPGRPRRRRCSWPSGSAPCAATTTTPASSPGCRVNESWGVPGLRKDHPGQYAFLERVVALHAPPRPGAARHRQRRLGAHRRHRHLRHPRLHAHRRASCARATRRRCAAGRCRRNAWDEAASHDSSRAASRYRGQPIMLTEVGGFLMHRRTCRKEKWDELYTVYGSCRTAGGAAARSTAT